MTWAIGWQRACVAMGCLAGALFSHSLLLADEPPLPATSGPRRLPQTGEVQIASPPGQAGSTEASEGAKSETAKSAAPRCEVSGFDWSKNPPVRLFPRPGNFAILPSGPGYYSLLDVAEDNYREAPPKFPYPPFCIIPFSFFDADFRYLDDPKN